MSGGFIMLDRKIMVEEYIMRQIESHYAEDIGSVQKTIEDFETYICERYIHKHWYRIKSKKYLKGFLFKLKNWKLLPTYVEYSDICKKNEVYSTTLAYVVRIGRDKLILNIPLLINISKLAKYLETENISQITFAIDELSEMVESDYWNDFEKDLFVTMQQRDILYEERKNNPIIVLNKSEVNDNILLNGNHRVMNLKLNNKQESVRAYVVNINDCIRFALTDDYVELFDALLNLRKNVKGSM